MLASFLRRLSLLTALVPRSLAQSVPRLFRARDRRRLADSFKLFSHQRFRHRAKDSCPPRCVRRHLARRTVTTGETPLQRQRNTGEESGPYRTQNSRTVHPRETTTAVDLRVDPHQSEPLIGQTKMVCAPRVYHLLGFYNRSTAARVGRLRSHVPGFEGCHRTTPSLSSFSTHFGNSHACFALPILL